MTTLQQLKDTTLGLSPTTLILLDMGGGRVFEAALAISLDRKPAVITFRPGAETNLPPYKDATAAASAEAAQAQKLAVDRGEPTKPALDNTQGIIADGGTEEASDAGTGSSGGQASDPNDPQRTVQGAQTSTTIGQSAEAKPSGPNPDIEAAKATSVNIAGPAPSDAVATSASGTTTEAIVAKEPAVKELNTDSSEDFSDIDKAIEESNKQD